MPRRIPLPPELRRDAFRVSTAREAGIGEGRLRGPDLARSFHGIRSPLALPAALAYAPLLRPGDRFSHTTAAALWPLPLPPDVDPAVHVTATAPRNAPRGAGVAGHVGPPGRVVLRSGMPVSDPISLFVELATLLDTPDLVAIGDALVLDPAVLDPHDLRPWITLDELRAGCAATRAHGCRAARRAAELVRVGAESRRETLLRLLLADAGLPEPELNGHVYDRAGRLIGRFDLVYRRERVLVEYDGDQHRTSREQYAKDVRRLERAIAAGWFPIRVLAGDLAHASGRIVARVAAALAR